MACKVSIAQLASWLAQQDAERRQRAQQAQRARRSAAAHSVAAEAPWDPCLAAVNTSCRNSGYANLTGSWRCRGRTACACQNATGSRAHCLDMQSLR